MSEVEKLRNGLIDEIARICREFSALDPLTAEHAPLSRETIISFLDSFTGKTAGTKGAAGIENPAPATTEHLASFPLLNPNPIIEVDGTGEVTFANRAAHDLTAAHAPRGLHALLPEDLPEILAALEEQEATAVFREVTVGDVVLAEHIYLTPRHRTARIYGVDVTKTKRAEESLRESETQFRVLADSIPQLAWMARADGHIAWYNRRWYDYTGKSPAEMEGWGWQSVHDPEVLPHVLDRWHTSIGTGNDFEMEFPLRGRDGTFRQFLTRVQPLRDSSGRIIQWFGTNTDITDLKEAEKALRDSESRSKDDALKRVALLDERVAERTAELAETINALQEEIIERELTEEALRKSETLLLTVLEILPAGVWIVDADGRITSANAAGKKIWGGAKLVGIDGYAEYRGWWHDTGNPLAPEDWAAARAIRNGETSLNEIIDIESFDGVRKTIASSCIPIRSGADEIVGAVVVNEEITERIRARERLLRLNRLYAVLSETNNAIARATDQDALFLDICSVAIDHGDFVMAWIGLLDRESGEVRPVASSGDSGYLESITITVGDEDSGRGPTGSAIREKRMFITNDFLGDSRTLPWHAEAEKQGYRSSAAIPLKLDGEVTGALTIYADKRDFFHPELVELLLQLSDDISYAVENLQRKSLLRQSEQKFRSLFEESKDAIIFMNADGRATDINRAGEELFGYSRDELLVLDIGRELFPDTEARKSLMEALKRDGSVKAREIELRRKDGTPLSVTVTASVTRSDASGITAYRAIIHDMTERKRLEQQLLQSQKMESIGLLAGGVAHDFNNLLTAIIGFGELLDERLQDPEQKEFLAHVMTAGKRGKDLTRKLLAFSHQQVMTLKPLDLGEVVSSLLPFLSRLIGEDIEVVTELTDRRLEVCGDPGQLEQVLTNLVINARDAMPRGGHLRIKTEAITLSAAAAREAGIDTAGEYGIVSITDNGAGIDAKHLEKVFEPFFTTKGIGQGTGLGLSIAFGIIKQHNGGITVESEPGIGSSFRIFLPLTPMEAPVNLPEPTEDIERGHERVLVVEDDDNVRLYLQTILSAAGYVVSTAADGEEAVQLLGREDFCLVISDVIMPRMNGKELYEIICRDYPKIDMIFISGYSADIISSKGIREGDAAFIQKPTTTAEILTTVRTTLDARNHTSSGR